MTLIETVIDRLVQHFAGEDFRDELLQAQRDFFGSPQASESKNHQFELQISQFFDWYIFSRDLSQYRQTPLEVCELERQLRFHDDEKIVLQKLRQMRHSLFEFQKSKEDQLIFIDLFKQEKIIIKNSSWLYGFEKDQILEARLVPSEDNWTMLKGVCLHPPEGKKYILGEVKRHRQDLDLNPEDLMLKLLKMKFRVEKYKHIKPDMIYSNEVF